MNHLENSDGTPRSIASLRAWESVRREIMADFESVAGPMPAATDRCALDAQTDDEVDCGSYVRRLITYTSKGTERTPAYLCVPKCCLGAHFVARPAILCLHGTDNDVGHGTVVGLSSRANRSYAAELAERGFVTLAPSYPLLANYQVAPSTVGFQSGTMMAIWDNIRGCDYLDSLPFVDHCNTCEHPPSRYGAIGHSLGGHNGIYTALFEPRIAIIVSSCGFDSYRDYSPKPSVVPGDISGWSSERYLPKLTQLPKIPGTPTHAVPFDFHDLVAALAPRPCFVSAPLHDANFKWWSVDKVVSAAKRVYDLYDAAQALHVEHPDCDHDFPVHMREKAYALFSEQLLPRSARL